MKIDPHNYKIPNDELLAKLSGKRLLKLRDKMNAIISKITSDYEWTSDEKAEQMKIAIRHKERILSHLNKFDHIVRF